MKCANCVRPIVPGKEWRDAGRPFCSKTCQEYAALLRIQEAAGRTFGPEVQTPLYLVLAVLLGAFMVIWATSPRKAWAREWPKVVQIETASCSTAEAAISILHMHKARGYEEAQSHFAALHLQSLCVGGVVTATVEEQIAAYPSLRIGNRKVDGYILEGTTFEGKTIYFIVLMPNTDMEA